MPPPPTIGRYRVLDVVGQGAMGVVYRGRDEDLDRDVAIKVMSVAQSADADARARFRREAQAAARLQHPNIVTIYELGEHKGTPFIAMEYLDGTDLQNAITSGLRPDPRVTLPIVLQLLAGLAHAHEHGIVHRDIKPSNLFLPRGRPAKIMDFGVARLAGGGTTAGTVVGTPNYMSPEQVQGAGLDGRSDLFSAGLILYELVTGERAFAGGTIVAVLYQIANESPQLSLLPRSPEWATLRAVVERALARYPEDRYPDARAMAVELSQALIELGGAADWASAADRGLLIRHTPKPMRRELLGATPAALDAAMASPSPPAPPHTEPAGARDAEPPAPSAASPRWLWMVVATGVLAFAVIVGLGIVWVLRPARSPDRSMESAATPSRVPGAVVTAPKAQRPEPSAASTPLPARATTPAPPPPAGASPFARAVAAATPAAGTAIPPAGRLEHASALLEAGRYQAALNEARAILACQPDNEEARTIAEDAEAALVVESRLRSAREAARRGDTEAALVEVRAGLAVAPNDARLLALFRELTH